MQTLNFSDEFSLKNKNLIETLITKPKDLLGNKKDILIDSKLLVPLFKSKEQNEMQQAMITLKNDKTYLLVFSNTHSFSSWSTEARPLPLALQDICENIYSLGIDGFIIDINEEHRFKVDKVFCNSIHTQNFIPAYLNEDFKKEIQIIVSKYHEIESVDFYDSNSCSARVVFQSKFDIADLVIEISKKLLENEQIQLFAPQGIDLFVDNK